MEPELVRVFTGLGVRLVVGEDDPGDLDPISEVVTAIIKGDLEELFGGGEGPPTSIGHRVCYSSGERRAGGAPVVAVRAPAG